MTSQITTIEDNKHKIVISFTDEGIELDAETTVLGSQTDAQRYVRTFARDVRRNNRGLFPPPPQPEPETKLTNGE